MQSEFNVHGFFMFGPSSAWVYGSRAERWNKEGQVELPYVVHVLPRSGLEAVQPAESG
jgi:hypothetical protein